MNSNTSNTKVIKLWNKQFIKLIIGWELTQIAQMLIRFALPLYVLQQTGNPALMGTVLALSAIPVVALTPIGGVIADRFNKRKLMAVINLITAIGVAIFFALSGLMDVVPAVVITFMFLLALESIAGEHRDLSPRRHCLHYDWHSLCQKQRAHESTEDGRSRYERSHYLCL